MSKKDKQNKQASTQTPVDNEQLKVNAGEKQPTEASTDNNSEDSETTTTLTPEEQIAALEQQVAELKNAML